MNAAAIAALGAIASVVVIAGGVRSVVRSVWKAVTYLERITRKIDDHDHRLERLENARNS